MEVLGKISNDAVMFVQTIYLPVCKLILEVNMKLLHIKNSIRNHVVVMFHMVPQGCF